MHSFRPLLPFLVFASAVALKAQSTVPAVTQQLPAQSLVAGGASVSIDLRNYFAVPGVTGQVAQFDTVLGKFNVELLSSAAPQTVTNFLLYVGAGSYKNSIIHRAVALDGSTGNRIWQGGGFLTSLAALATAAPIPLEYNLANTRGTLAMARTSDLNSATSGWFFNVDDNTTALGVSNGGGYAVFARVLGTGMSVVDAIAAVPVITAFNSPFDHIPLRNYQSGQNVTTDNYVTVNNVTAVPVYPTIGFTGAVLGYSGNFTTGGVVTGSLLGSKLVLTPLAGGSTNLTVTATDTNNNTTSSTIAITVATPPAFATQPVSQAIAAGQSVGLTATVTTGTPVFQWQLNGNNVGGISNPTAGTTLTLGNVQPSYAGLYVANATNGGVVGASAPAIVGIATTSEVIGNGSLLQPTHIQHQNGNFYDQVLLTGEAETITTPGYVVRTSFIDPNDDIVQVEFGGHGNLSVVLDGLSGPATAVNYNQSSVNYMKGRACIVITGADETTNVLVFTVGRATAFDPTGAYNILAAPDATTNNPTNNGSPLFVGHGSTVYDGVADIAFIAISSPTGKFGGVRASNTRFGASKGYTGIYAPGVTFTGPVWVGDINASNTAIPVLMIGSGSDVRITGGSLTQSNSQPLKVTGITQLKFTAGLTSGGTSLPKTFNQALLLQNSFDVTDQIVSYQ